MAKIGWCTSEFNAIVSSLIITAWDYVHHYFSDLVDIKLDEESWQTAEAIVLSHKLQLRSESVEIWCFIKSTRNIRIRLALTQKIRRHAWNELRMKALQQLDKCDTCYVPRELQLVFRNTTFSAIPPLGVSVWVIEETIKLILSSLTSQNSYWGAVSDVMVETKNETDNAMKKPGILKKYAETSIPGKALRVMSRGGNGASEVKLIPEMRYRIDNLLSMDHGAELKRIMPKLLKRALSRRGEITAETLQTILGSEIWERNVQKLSSDVGCSMDLARCECLTFALEMLRWHDTIYDLVISALPCQVLKEQGYCKKVRLIDGIMMSKNIVFFRQLIEAFEKGRKSAFWTSCPNDCIYTCSCPCHDVFLKTTYRKMQSIICEEEYPFSGLHQVLEAASIFQTLDVKVLQEQLGVEETWEEDRTKFWKQREKIRLSALEEAKYIAISKTEIEYDLPREVTEDVQEEKCSFTKGCTGKLRIKWKQLRSSDEPSEPFLKCNACKIEKKMK